MPEEQIRDPAGRQRQPEGDDPVEERRGQRIVARDAGERQRSHETGFDKAETARGERDQRENFCCDVREQDERWLWVRADRVQCGEQGEIVEAGVAGRRQDGATTMLADRRANEVAAREQPFGETGHLSVTPDGLVQEPLNRPSHQLERPVARERDGACSDE